MSSYLQTGTVCVCSNHGKPISWKILSTHSKGYEAGEVSGHKVLQRWINIQYYIYCIQKTYKARIFKGSSQTSQTTHFTGWFDVPLLRLIQLNKSCLSQTPSALINHCMERKREKLMLHLCIYVP